MYMSNEPLMFNDLPQVIAELRDEVSGMKALTAEPSEQTNSVEREQTPPCHARAGCRVHQHSPCDYLSETREQGIPGSKPGKRWVIYLDEIDKWLEANRKNPIPLTDEEQNAAILASHKRKPNKSSWNDEGSAQRSQPIAKPFDGDKI